MTEGTKLIGYRKLKSFELSPTGEISNVELGSFSVWEMEAYHFCEPSDLWHIWLDLDKLPSARHPLGLDEHRTGLYKLESCDKIALKEEDARQIVLKHIGDPPISMTLSARDTTGVLTPRFRQLSPTLKSKLLQSMEVRV